jgi:TonB family protein
MMGWKTNVAIFVRTPATAAAIVVALLAPTLVAFGEDSSAPTQQTAPQQTSPTPSQSAQPTRIRLGSNVQSPKVIHRTAPIYPAVAKAARVEGTVVLHAIIAKDGGVQKLDPVSGPPLLVQAALDAVRQWQYEPTVLDGQPVEVDTTIQVVFSLPGPGAEGGGEQGSTTVDPKTKEDALHLFEVMHLSDRMTEQARTVFQAMRPTILASLPPTANRDKIADAYEDKLAHLLTTPDVMDQLAEIYARYLSDDDIKAVGEFYQTPAGQHYFAFMPQLTAEAMQVGQNAALGNMKQVFKELCKEYPELQATASFCPKDQNKKSLLLAPTDSIFAVAAAQ